MKLTLHHLHCPHCKATFKTTLPEGVNPHAPVQHACANCLRDGPKRWLRSSTTEVEDTPNRVARKRSHYQHPKHGIA